MRQWTPEQHTAIFSTGGTVLVSAGAGSGKTAVLVERAAQLILREQDPVSADRLLLVTFSNAAAAEIRGRIARRIEEQTVGELDGANPVLLKQKYLLGRAHIETVHAFCLSLIREYFSLLALPPDFGVGDEGALFGARQAAMAETLEAAYDEADFAPLAALYGKARSDRAVQGLVQSLYDFSRTLPFPEKALGEMAEAYQRETPFFDTPAGGQFCAAAAEKAVGVAAQLKAAAQIAREGGIEPYVPHLEGEAEAFSQLASLLRQCRWDEALAFAGGLGFRRLPTTRKADPAAKEAVKVLRDRAKKDWDSLLKRYLFATAEEAAAQRREAAPFVAALVRVTLDFAGRYWQKKVEARQLEFSDFEHLALQLLYDREGDKTALAAEIAGRFDMVLVDEYQDTSAIQDAIFAAVANEQKSNLFFVGDVKQSIYRFRQADPTLFLEKQKRFFPAGEGRYPMNVGLHRNFRSEAAVLQSINRLFATLMTEQLGELNYTQEEFLLPGAAQTGAGKVAFHLVDLSAGGTEANYVTNLVQQLVQGGFQVAEGEGTRPAKYEDICILLRSPGATGAAYAAALEAKGIAAVFDSDEELLLEPVLQPLLSALAAVDNPSLEIPLTAAMLSPLFGFSADDLVALRVAQPKGSFYGAVNAGQKGPQREKIGRLLGFLARYRRFAATKPVQLLAEDMLRATGYEDFAFAMEGGEGAGEVLSRFLALAAQYDAAGAGGLSGFLRYLDDLKESGRAGRRGAASAGRPGVRIMSVHRSKGLEFSVCILAETNRRFNRQDLNSPMLFHQDLGIGMQLRREQNLIPTLAFAAVRDKKQQELLSEEMRVLYVALTRAKSALFVTCGLKNRDITLPRLALPLYSGQLSAANLTGLQSPGEWMLSALLLQPEGKPLRALAGTPDLPLSLEPSGIEMVIALAGALAETENNQERRLPPLPPADPALVEQLLQRFAAQPEPPPPLPAKLSVSEVAKSGEDIVLERPSFLYPEGLTAAERGTALHAFFQFADYEKARRDPAAELQRLVAEAFMLPEMAASVDLQAVAHFFTSPLGQEMAKAREVRTEVPFLTEMPASQLGLVPPGSPEDAPVLLQGVADCILLHADNATLVDYKTDRGVDEGELLRRYAKQLQLYALALAKRLPVPIRRCVLYSFYLGKAVEVPL